MIIGVPKEIKDHETRVGITPAGVKALTEAGHKVLVETHAGELSAFTDDDYQGAGAEIVGSAHNVWGNADMVVKVKEPVEKEYGFFRPDLTLFTYLHLAPLPVLTDQLLQKKVTGIAYETIRDRNNALPLLTPMSEVAGRMSVQVGATYLEKEKGGRGLLLGGVPGVTPANVCIIGGGIVGTNAAKIALGMGAKVTLIDLNLNRLRELDDIFNGRVFTLASNSYNLALTTREADLVIGGVLIPGAAAPKIVTAAMVAKMKKGAVIVDVAIDQGGCIETAKPTTHSNPSYEVNGVVHYCVTNMPAAVPNTSTLALTNATFPYVMKIAQLGAKQAILSDNGTAEGVNTYAGALTYHGRGRSRPLPVTDADSGYWRTVIGFWMLKVSGASALTMICLLPVYAPAAVPPPPPTSPPMSAPLPPPARPPMSAPAPAPPPAKIAVRLPLPLRVRLQVLESIGVRVPAIRRLDSFRDKTAAPLNLPRELAAVTIPLAVEPVATSVLPLTTMGDVTVASKASPSCAVFEAIV
jgi:alanine dehydrogenase